MAGPRAALCHDRWLRGRVRLSLETPLCPDDVGNVQRARLAVAQQALVDARDQDQRRRVEIKRSRRRG